MYTIHNAILWAPFLFDGMVFSKFVESVLKNLSQHVDTDTDFWISSFQPKNMFKGKLQKMKKSLVQLAKNPFTTVKTLLFGY